MIFTKLILIALILVCIQCLPGKRKERDFESEERTTIQDSEDTIPENLDLTSEYQKPRRLTIEELLKEDIQSLFSNLTAAYYVDPSSNSETFDLNSEGCEKKFSNVDESTLHEKQHRPFTCTVEGCNKSFLRSFTLKVHQLNHI